MASAGGDRVQQDHEVAAIMGALYGDGIVSLKGAFERDFVESLHSQCLALYEEASRLPGGAVPRGPNRWYVELQPERVDGFAQIAAHPWFVAVSSAVLGAEYKIVEFGFDIPFPGAADQPWHRDFPGDAENALGHRLSSLAFNLTTVDTRPEHGPFELAPGTQWDDIRGAKAGMFPPPERWDRYRALARRTLPQRGDISARTGLTIHRGTANVSSEPRPVLIVGVVADDVADAEAHQLQATAGFIERLPAIVRDHLFYRLTDVVGPLPQQHMIEGLLDAAYG
jgi:ectoine hydroxylase-related dioxygenase (phytanoyl-CoA dioxygenase family)